MITVIPLTDAERDAHRCAYCDKHLAPSRYHGNGKLFWGRETAEFEAFTTNRRVISVRRQWSKKVNVQTGDLTGEKYVHRIDINFMPDDDRDWGYDGLFCSSTHAMKFAHACHRAGFRMKRKVTA